MEVRILYDLKFASWARAVTLPAGTLAIAEPADNIPPDENEGPLFWVKPVPGNTDWPSDTAQWSDAVGCLVFRSEFVEV